MWGKYTLVWIFAFFALFLNATQHMPDLGIDKETLNTLLSMSTFTFAIILGFSLTRRHARPSNIMATLRKADATMINIYDKLGVFQKSIQKKSLKLLDGYLTSQLDYALQDFRQNMPALIEFLTYLTKMKATGSKQQIAYNHIGSFSSQLVEQQKEMEYLVNSNMPIYEWGSLIFLCLTIWIGMLLTPVSSVIGILLMSILASVFFLLLLVLKDLNALTWRAEEWIWTPLFNLFNDLNLRPYIPTPIIGKHISASYLEQFDSYRLVTYPNQYPDISNKKVVLIKNKR